MTKDTTKEAAVAAEGLLFDDWFDAVEDGVRSRVRGFIEIVLEEELSGGLCQSNGRSTAGSMAATKWHSSRKSAPLGQRTDASLFVNLAGDEMALLIEDPMGRR